MRFLRSQILKPNLHPKILIETEFIDPFRTTTTSNNLHLMQKQIPTQNRKMSNQTQPCPTGLIRFLLYSWFWLCKFVSSCKSFPCLLSEFVFLNWNVILCSFLMICRNGFLNLSRLLGPDLVTCSTRRSCLSWLLSTRIELVKSVQRWRNFDPCSSKWWSGIWTATVSTFSLVGQDRPSWPIL